MKFFTLIVVIFFGFYSRAQTYSLSSHIQTDEYLKNTLILKVKNEYRSICSQHQINHPSVISAMQTIGLQSLKKKFPNDKPPIRVYNEYGIKYADLSLIFEFKYTSNTDIQSAINLLNKTNIFEYVEPHFIPKLTYNPNDPLATPSSQYHLATINAFAAWDINKGDSSIVIGITDTGTDFSHNDLFGNIKRNFNDVLDGNDNDGDGYIDNYWGWDLGMEDNDPTYQGNAHGVHVQGIASATPENNNGGIGVGFNCKVMPIKISDANVQLIAAYEGIKYAADHGCHVINCSWGGGSAGQYGQDIIDYATINKNCLVIASAGNNGADGDFYPAAFNYVLSIANTSANDVKHSSSNYGYFVDVCAPGDNISSTWPGNIYNGLTGTSMSAPVVAGAAGIVKNHFPSYNGLQVGERLRVTADNIYPVNPTFNNKLGKGRINLFRALNNPPTPSIVYSHLSITDRNDDSFVSGDTLFIVGNFFNYLDPTTALNVTVTPLSPIASAVSNTISFGTINTLTAKTNTFAPFAFKLNGTIPVNQPVNFEVFMKDGAYEHKQFFTINVNVDFINIAINDVATTATSKGKIGYNQNSQTQGLGFNYKGTDLLYEGGLMIGVDTTKVSDCVRGTNVSFSDIDFGTTTRIYKQIPAFYSDFDTKAKMNDNLAFNPLSIEVEQNTLAWNTVPNKQFVIWEYRIKNTHATDTLKNLYAGIFADWDIDGGTYAQNRSDYDAVTKMGYSFYTGAHGKYGGIKLLTNNAPANFYAMDNVAGGNGGIDISNGFDTKEKYRTLSTQRLTAGVAGSGSDVINVMSTGPIQLLPGQLATVAFAIIGGDSLKGIKDAANQAQIKYFGFPTRDNVKTISEEALSIFPNPAKGSFVISQSKLSFTKYEIYDINGRLISEENISSMYQTVDLKAYSEGIYIVKLISREKVEFKKIVVLE
jgi:serine protease